ncbi:FecR domain-containing protein [Methylomonas sp. AM2-LC]|uniref:FecR domain-containing protein n=1 Tax=Methylomonas sp. AM2-LC TaxID=3153301 RepID=UPI0032661D33
MYLLVVLLLVLFSSICSAGDDIAERKLCSEQNAAKVVSLQGDLFFDGNGQGQWQPAQLNDILCEGGRVRLDSHSRASILLPDKILLRLDAGTVLSLNGIAVNKPTALDLLKGFVHFISRTPRHMLITTPIASAGPEGTEFALHADQGATSLWVYEGAVRLFNNLGDLQLKAGETAIAELGQIPRVQIDIKPNDAVNWALYYPSLLPYNAAADIDGGNNQDLQLALADFRHGKIDKALARLNAVSPEQREFYYFKVRGAMLLSLGRIELALEDIKLVQSKKPNDAEALALLSVLALTQNHKEQAYDLANQAISADPSSAAAFSALSYAEQSRFELENALHAADQAVKNAPRDALVWARKAELELSLGLTVDTDQAAEQAFKLDPDLERTQTVLGFSYLLHGNTAPAFQAFSKAVNLDSASPLARLGLGLARIRNGELAEGRQDLEIAAGLDPANAMIRSYLGKAYYEEKRNELAQNELDLAKQRDPKDPTAFLYNAILKLTTNRPVSALSDISKAIDLNDNRAVYRSSLSLDKDLAARSAAQGRIYDELGYQQLGLLQGWKSLNADSNNYSAHRLLADDYAALPRHEIARVSELLQSQLLQPINITPIQPNLAESSLFVLNSLGPGSLGFNEFNPLFEYNRMSLQASGIYGGNNTIGDNAQLSGIHDNLSFSLGQFNYGTDGFRENNFFKRNMYNAFLQNKVSDKLNLQFEYRHEVTGNGDLGLNFDRSNFDKNYSQNTSVDSYRVGGHYEFNPKSSLITSAIYQSVDVHQSDLSTKMTLNTDPDTGIIDSNATTKTNLNNYNRRGFISELQHNFIDSKFNIINGVGYLDQDSIKYNSSLTSSVDFFTFDGISIGDSSSVTSSFKVHESRLKRANFYNYSKIYLPEKFTLTLGFSVDWYNNLPTDQTEDKLSLLNPKFGLMWSPNNATTFRTAFFRASSIARNFSQTIEPTQVAGFNQFFDDILGTISWRSGFGVDHKFSNNFSSGLEFSKRNLDIPQLFYGLYRSEQIGRAYFNFIPHDQFSLGLEYFYEKINQTGLSISSTNAYANLGMFNSVETHRIPLTVSFFDTSGFSIKIKNSFVHQSGEFQNQSTNNTTNGVSDFFVSDLNLSYRIPKRHGMISIGVNNLFSDKFNYQNTDYNDVTIAPGRVIFSRITLAF